MPSAGVYGSRLASRFRLEAAPVLVSKTLQKTEVAVTNLQLPAADHRLTEAIPHEDAYLVAVMLRDVLEHELWLDGRAIPRSPFLAGSTVFYDLKRNPIARCLSPFNTLFFYVPRGVFDLVADQAEASHVDELNYVPGEAIADALLHGLARTLLPALDRPDEVNRLYFEHVALAACTHIAHTYGGMVARSSKIGVLAPWQERRAKALIAANLQGDLSRAQLAAECGLSADYFGRAFKRTTGTSPHQWLMQRRVDVTKDLLRCSNLTLAEVAVAAGFHDQSHMSRVFSQATSTTPASWRRDFDAGDARRCLRRHQRNARATKDVVPA
ncbi:helix-turn-helix domain-containing protein [Lichenihabitans psoromatis]|uniref:helix-turn-helix domain-containing protein n=1 Tax=Lichenihabitans psoromatis TaxID=2528642 RepID=UPI0010383D4B|nr:AraC family transcriptional regulator [Lichenihabitans psoromatis]